MLSPPTLDRVALFVVKTHQRQVDWLLYDSAALSCPPLPCHCLASPRNCQIVDGAQGCAVVCPHHSKRCSYSGSRFRILTWNLARCFSCQFIQLSKKRNSVFSQILMCEFDFRFFILQMYRLLSTVYQQNLCRELYSHVAAVSVKTGRCQFHAVLAQSMSDQTRSFSDFKSS